MTDFLNPIAELEKPDSGKLVLPNQAYEIRDDNKFFCPDFDCLDNERILIVKKSNKDNYFFSHRPNCGHDIRPETLLHKLAVKWFIDKENYEIPSYNVIKKQNVILDKTETKCEFRQLQRIIPDVILKTNNGFQFAVEIVVTSDIDKTKAKLIKEFNLPTIRVDLQSFYYENKKNCQTDFNFIMDNLPALMCDAKLKSWVISPDIESIKDKLDISQTNLNDGCATLLFGFGLFLLIKKLLK